MDFTQHASNYTEPLYPCREKRRVITELARNTDKKYRFPEERLDIYSLKFSEHRTKRQARTTYQCIERYRRVRAPVITWN